MLVAGAEHRTAVDVLGRRGAVGGEPVQRRVDFEVVTPHSRGTQRAGRALWRLRRRHRRDGRFGMAGTQLRNELVFEGHLGRCRALLLRFGRFGKRPAIGAGRQHGSHAHQTRQHPGRAPQGPSMIRTVAQQHPKLWIGGRTFGGRATYIGFRRRHPHLPPASGGGLRSLFRPAFTLACRSCKLL